MNSYVAQNGSASTTTKTGKRSARRRRQPYAWLGASALTFGVGVALAGAGTAHADDAPSVDSTRSAKASTLAPRGGTRHPDSSRVNGSMTGTRAARDSAVGAAPNAAGAAARAARRDAANTDQANGRTAAILRQGPADGPLISPAAGVPINAVALPAVAASLPISAANPSKQFAAASDSLRPSDSILRRARVLAAASTGFTGLPSITAAQTIQVAAQPSDKPGLGLQSALAVARLKTMVLQLWHELEYTFGNQKPSAKPFQFPSTNTTPVVAGTLNAIGPYGDSLTFSVAAQPANGTVTVTPDGNYAYTPNATSAVTGGADSFTVKVTNAAVHPLANLFGPARYATVVVPVTAAPVSEINASATTVQFDVWNTSTQLMQFAGYGSVPPSLAPAIGTTIATGESVHFEADAGGQYQAFFNPVGTSHAGVTGYINTGFPPQGLAFSTDGKTAYVAITSSFSKSLQVVDTTTGLVKSTIQLPGTAYMVAVNPNGKYVYVSEVANVSNGVYDTAQSQVAVIDTATNQIASTVTTPGGDGIFTLAVSPNGTRLYAVNGLNATVSVIDTATNLVIGNPIVVGSPPPPLSGHGQVGAAVSPDGGTVYVANAGDRNLSYGSLAVINAATDTVTNTVQLPVRSDPTGVAVNPITGAIYVADGNGGVYAIDPISLAVSNTIDTGPGSYPGGLAVSSDGTRLYIAEPHAGAVLVIDTATGARLSTFNSGGSSSGTSFVAVSPDGSLIYASNYFDKTIAVISSPSGNNDGGIAQFTITMSAATASCTSKGVDGQQCATGGTATYLEDAPGTFVTIPEGEAQQQSDVLQSLVNVNLSNATFSPSADKPQPIIGYTNPKMPINFSPYTNYTTEKSTNSYTITATNSAADSTQYQTSVKLSESAKIYDLGVAAEASWQNTTSTVLTNTFTYTQTVNQTLKGRDPATGFPGEQLFLYYETPVLRFYGNWSVLYGNTTYNLVNVWYNTPYVAEGWPVYLVAYTCDVGSDACAQLQKGQTPASYGNPWPVGVETLPILQTSSSTKCTAIDGCSGP